VSQVKFRLSEAALVGTMLPSVFCLFHWIEGSRPFITEFEAGAIWAVILLKLNEALRASPC
jgi:hypothetical protein